MRTMLVVLGLAVVVTWVVVGLLGSDGFRPRVLGELVGVAVLLAVAGEVVVVGGAAVRGMLRAGERGHRLAGADVSLLPPQLGRRRR